MRFWLVQSKVVVKVDWFILPKGNPERTRGQTRHFSHVLRRNSLSILTVVNLARPKANVVITMRWKTFYLALVGVLFFSGKRLICSRSLLGYRASIMVMFFACLWNCLGIILAATFIIKEMNVEIMALWECSFTHRITKQLNTEVALNIHGIVFHCQCNLIICVLRDCQVSTVLSILKIYICVFVMIVLIAIFWSW